MSQKELAVIGTGMMGQAILSGLIQKEVFSPASIVVSDPDGQKTGRLQSDWGVSVADSNPDAVAGAKIVLLAVKPQFLKSVMRVLKGKLSPESLLISIITGVSVETLRDGLEHDAIIRVMPNTPAQTGDGISGWYAAAEVTIQQKEQAAKILSALGPAVLFEKESDLDIVTAVSGSGPAYVFLFIEAMVDAGVQMGLSRAVAQELVVQTVKGSAAYLEKRAAHPAVLRNEVTSPGGTTAEALFFLEQGGLRSTVARAMWACYERSVALGEGQSHRKGPVS